MIAAIEKAVIQRLRDASDRGVLGYEYKTYVTSPVEWDAWLKETPGALKSPAAWVVFTGSQKEKSDAHSPLFTWNFALVVLAENQRNDEEFRRHGNGREVGSYQLIEDAIALLSGQNLGLDIGSITIDRVRPIPSSAAQKENKISLMALEFSTTAMSPDAYDYRDADDDFLRTQLNWSAVDASDLIELQEDV